MPLQSYIKKAFVSRELMIGSLPLGGHNPIRLQSMTSTDTSNTGASVAQCIRIFEAGADMVRLTARDQREAANLANIKQELRKAGFTNPLIADIHFNPTAAETAARIVEKVRINPGNYADKRAAFVKTVLSDSEYAGELERIHQRLLPLIKICREHGTAIRVGVNHGSLSDRIMTRYGNTALGMAISAMEFTRIFNAENFSKLVLSMKSSNILIMTEATLLLVEMMQKEDMACPLHLGVTEAGEGEDGRIRSAMGIGALLVQGIGDTIRVSLSEPPEDEIPVAKQIVACAQRHLAHDPGQGEVPGKARLTGSGKNPVLSLHYDIGDPAEQAITAAVNAASLLLARKAGDVKINNRQLAPDILKSIEDGILQAARIKISRNDYISCPTCGRTGFDLPAAVARVRKATSHLTGLKIAIMGCIVNGPGEMADADYGYIGASNGKVHIYRGQTPVFRNIPEEEAVDKLLKLIEEDRAGSLKK